jgi:hypothetical protein
MNRKFALHVVCVVAGLICSRSVALDTYTLADTGTAGDRVFTNTVGTSSSDGTLIVFEGELESFIDVPKSFNLTSGLYLASLQLLAQIRLFDELPVSNEVGTVQGAVAAIRDGVGLTTGTYYAWGLSNGAPTWVQLMTTNTPPAAIAVNDGETNYVTFVFSYPEISGPVSYKVYIGDSEDQVMESSEWVDSPTTVVDGISSVSLVGVGGIEEVGSASGSTGPLSTSVDFSVYATTNGVRVEVYTVNENGSGAISVYAQINGEWTLIGTIPAEKVVGSGSNKYTLYVTGLEVGQSYMFKIVDEANHTHTSTTAIEVKSIKMDAVTMTLDTMRVTFNTEYGQKYLVKVSEDLAAPIGLWSTEFVSRYDAATGNWSVYTNVPFMAGPGLQTVIQIPMSKNKAFFKVILVDEAE